jgi:hypothetical protein
VFRAFAAVAGPQPEDVTVALGGDRQGYIDRPVRYLAIANLDVDGVDEDDRVDTAVSIGGCDTREESDLCLEVEPTDCRWRCRSSTSSCVEVA